jgi:hypothetical protein
VAGRAAMALVVMLTLPAVGFGQMTRGSIAGTVRDSSGAIVPGATVTVISVATNATQTVTTDAEGFYRVPALEPGRYQVTTELSGFRTVEQRDIDVRSALETPVDVRLEPAGIGETVQVLADAGTAGLNRVNPTISTTITSRMVEELPLPQGRNINNLVLTVPNASSTVGQGTYAVNGNRPRNNNYMIDGSDNNDMSVTIPTSSVVPEAVAEFQVMQNPYNVEFGRNSGGQINVITKSGTNSFHGDFFDYYQASGLNSLNNIEKASGLTVPAKEIRHQLGGDIGGPIFRDRLFFFSLYQRDSQQRASRPSPLAVSIPTQQGFAALANVPLGANQPTASRQAIMQRLNFLQDVYAQNPTFRNVSTSMVNGVPVEIGTTNVTMSDPSLYHTFLNRGDFRPLSNSTYTVRHSLNDNVDEAIAGFGFGELFAANQDIVDSNLAISNAHIFSGSLLNEARFSLVQRDLAFPENDPASPTATITGAFQVGGDSNFPQGRFTKSYQFSNTLTWTRARHSMKFGVDLRYNDAVNESGFNTKGTFIFDNVQDFLNNEPSRLQLALQTSSWHAKQLQSFFFVQDDFRVTPNLTLNLGLRYEISEVPFGMFGAEEQQVRDALVPGPVKVDTDNWAPRVGFAYSPQSRHWLIGEGKTVVRGGYGVAYDVLFFNLLTVNASNYPRIANLDEQNREAIRNLYPNLVGGSSQVTFNPLNGWTNSAENTESPESRFYSLSVQRELGRYLFELGYSGSRGAKGINQIVMNPAILTPEQAALVAATRSNTANGALPSLQSRRLYPNFGVRTVIPGYVGPAGNDVEAKSEYNAIFVSAQRRLSNGLQFNTSYTFSRWMSNNDASLGEGGTTGSSQRPQNMFDYEAEWARSQYDRPHRFTISYLWEVPGPRTGILGQVIGGWQLSGVTQAQSGRPFTIFTGVDSNGDSNTGSDRPNVNPSGTFSWDKDHRNFTNAGYYVVPLGTNNLPLANSLGDGNAGRNTERMAGFWNTDLALMKRFDLPGTVRFTVRLDAFNAFNQDNYGGAPNTTIQATFNNMSSPNFGVNLNNWGRRVLQLSGKFTF